MKPKSWTYLENFLIKVLVVVASVSQLACSPALISVLGAGSLTKLFQFPTWESQLSSGTGTQALNSGMGGNGNILEDSFGTVICASTTGQIGSNFPYSTVPGSQDTYISRFDKNGLLLWTIEISAGAGSTTAINGCLNDGLNDGYTYVAANSTSDFHSYSNFTLFGAVGAGVNSLLFKISPTGVIAYGIQISAGNQPTSLNGAAPDSSGNFVVIGTTNGIFLTGGTNIGTNAASSNSNGFVLKIPASATSSPVTPIWLDVFSGGSFSTTQPQNVVFDSSNNAFVIGTTNGTVATTPTHYGGINGTDIFAYKLTASGLVNWGPVQFGDANNNFLGTMGSCGGGGNNPGLTLDSSGNVYIWGPACAISATTGLTPLGGAGYSTSGDLFAAQIMYTGVLGWNYRIQCGAAGSNCQSYYPNGNQGGQGGLFVVNNNIYVTGQTSGTITASNDGTMLGTPGTSNLFFMNLSQTGTVQTLIQYGNGSVSSLDAQSAVVDANGHLIIAGIINNSTLLGSTFYGAQGNLDVFLICFDGSANPQWIDQFGGGGFGSGSQIQNISLQLDSTGQAVVVGSYNPNGMGSSVFGAGYFSTTLFGNVGGPAHTDGIIFQVAPTNGKLNWSAQMGAGTSNNLSINSVAKGAGGIYVLGNIANASGVSGGTGTLYGSGSGIQNAFLAGISVLGPK